jgi:lysozyme
MIKWLLLAAGVALLIGALALLLHRPRAPAPSDSIAYTIRGIDISHHQHRIDWARLPAQNIRFAYLKASEGGDWIDPSFADNRARAQASGLAVGAYHYFTLCASGAVQAANFIRAVPVTAGLVLPPAIDLEYVGNCAARPGHGKLAHELKVFIAVLLARYHAMPVLYSTQTFFDDYLARDPAFAGYPLWVRNLNSETEWALGHAVLFRQFASHARLAGIDGPVDLDLFAGSKAQFAELTAPR